MVNVVLCDETEFDLGHARVVRIVTMEALNPRYGFQFVKK